MTHSHDHSHDHSDKHSDKHSNKYSGQSHHGHVHDHGPVDGKFNLAFLISILANSVFTVIESVYSYFAHSTSLLADAGHNLGDILGLIFAWIAAVLLEKSANARFSYGFKRTSIIAALTNAIILLLSTLLIIREAIEKFVHPASMIPQDVMVIAGVGILVHAATALLFMRGRHDDLNIRGAFVHLAYDALTSLGVVMAAGVIFFTHWEWLDPLVGLFIGGMILLGTGSLLKNSLNLIMDGVPEQIQMQEVEDYFLHIPGVTSVHDLHIWGLSTKDTALTVHLIMPNEKLSDDQRHEITDILNTKFKINHVTIQVEEGNGNHDCAKQAC